MKIACIQLTSGADMAGNIAKIEGFVEEAAAQGAEFVALPENAFLMDVPGAKRTLYRQEEHPGVQAAALMAKRHGIWLLAGSVAVAPEENPEGKTYNRSLLFNPQGEIAASYDKIHLFDVEVGDGQTYQESARILPGDKAVVAALSPQEGGDTPIKLGMSICYDLRFPHLYRRLAKGGAEIMVVPAAFTVPTGEAHWEVLLRARAIENGCFVLAPAQCGEHPGGRKTYGHSLVVNPWGKVLADGGTQEGIVMADINLDEVKRVRNNLPSLGHDRGFHF